jgi:hypothetical protein
VAAVVAGASFVLAVVEVDVVGVLVFDVLEVEVDDEVVLVVDEVVDAVLDELVVSDVVGSGNARTNVTFRLTAGVPVLFFTVSV